MQLKSAELQDQMNDIDRKIQEGVNLSSRNQLEADRNNLNEQLQAALINEQAHENRIQEATAESSSFLGDIDIAGVPIAESGLSELAFSVLNAKVQAKHVAAIEKISLAMAEMQANHQFEMSQLTKRAEDSEYTAENLNTLNNDQNVKIYQLETENAELDNKVRKGADLLAEATETIKKQEETIEKYKKAELLGTPQKALPDTSEQVALNEAAFKASQIPVVSMVVDEADFARKTWIIETVVPSEKRSIHYFEKGLYRVVNAEEAEQIRVDEANKKAEAELQNTIIPVMTQDIAPVNPVSEEEATTKEETFQSDQVQTADSGTDTETNRNENMEPMVGQSESEVITLESLHAKVLRLENAVYGAQTEHKHPLAS